MSQEKQNNPPEQDKYAKLAGNTVLFAISSFSSKILSFLIRPFVTNVLADPALVGVTNITTQCANVLIPVVSMGIANAIIRFGLDKRTNKREVFTNSFLSIVLGFFILLCLFPVLQFIPSVSEYIIYLYVYVLTSCLRTLCTHFVRSQQRNRLVALDGILCTLATLLFYILFLVVFPMGAAGYLLAIICADLCSAAFIFVSQKLWRVFEFSHINRKLWFDMLKFSLPMIPAQISFWIINASDLFFVQTMLDGSGGYSGDHWVGLLSTAYFLPLILNTLGVIFYDAWQLSAVTEESGRESFFGRIFQTYSSMLFCIASGIILLCQPLMLVFRDAFFEAWVFVPFLTIAATFTCFNQFFNSIYVVYKRSVNSFLTMFLGAVFNCVFNYVLILRFGVVGAAAASMLGMMLVFVLRALDTNRMLKMNLAPKRLLCNVVLVLAQAFVMLADWSFSPVLSALVTVTVVLLNWRGIWQMIALLLPKVLGARGKKLVQRFTPPTAK